MGVPLLEIDNQDNRTCMRRQTFRYPDVQTNKALQNSVLRTTETNNGSCYSIQNTCAVLHGDEGNNRHIQRRPWDLLANALQRLTAAIHTQTHTHSLDHLSQGNLTTFRGSYQFVGHKALCDRRCRV